MARDQYSVRIVAASISYRFEINTTKITIWLQLHLRMESVCIMDVGYARGNRGGGEQRKGGGGLMLLLHHEGAAGL